jgi:CheY-like chemotaxis protein
VSKRILFVEDDQTTVRVLQFALGQNGYRVAAANGPEFLDRYRTSGGRAKVIAISGSTHSDPMTQGLRVDEFIGKPFDIEHVVRSVRRFAYS